MRDTLNNSLATALGDVSQTSGMSTSSALSSKRSAVVKDAHSYVGFANFPNQVFRRAIKNGFEFTLMVVGQSGLGKSTFINSLFSSEINERLSHEPVHISPTTRIQEKTVRLVENGVTLDLTLVDSPGFGDAIDNNKCWEPIVEYVERKYLDYFSEETKIERAATISDRRVHLCLYFITPSGHGLKQLDIEFMKKLHDRVNVIPVIAKADTLTRDELSRFKKQILKEVEENNIKLYKFPECEDEDEKRQFGPLRERVPFAVVGSSQVKECSGHRIRVREYPWGVVEVENLDHNDFIALRDMIIRTNLIDLIAVTRSVHYENFRYRQMSKGPKNTLDKDPFTQLEQEKRLKEEEFNTKKMEMEKVLQEKINEREKKLAARQAELDNMEKENHALLQKRRAALDQLMSEVVELRRNGGISRQDSRASSTRIEGSSPDKMKTKKTLGLFKTS